MKPIVLKQSHAEYMREWRKRNTEEQRKRNAELTRERMKQYRKRKREAVKGAHRTRQEEKIEEERKLKQRDAKRLYRLNMSAQKKRRVREKDARRKKEIRKSTKVMAAENIDASTSAITSECALKKYVSRRCKMPGNAMLYARVCKRLITNVTPKRRKSLETEGINPDFCKRNLSNIMETFKEASQALAGRTGEKQREKRQFLRLLKSLNKTKETQKLVCCAMGIKKKYFSKTCYQNVQRKRRSDALSVEIQTNIENFFNEDTNSTAIPDKKAIDTKNFKPKKVLLTSLKNTYKRWCELNPEKKVSVDKFTKLKPKHILTQKHRKLFQCLCEYCENVKLKLKVLKLAMSQQHMNMKDLISDEFTAVNSTLCDKEGNRFAKLECIDRKCDNCGTKLLQNKLRPLFQAYVGDVKWQRWEQVKRNNPKTNKEIAKQEMVQKSGNIENLWAELQQELHFLSVHLFQAKWQQEQFAHLHSNLPSETVSLTIDFAENYTCFSQNEIQGAHWAKDSVTLHPCIARYLCPNGCKNEIVEECVNIVSDDLLHDSHAVHTFTKKIVSHLVMNRKVNLKHLIIISDGCASQYKSKLPFMDVSCSKDDFGVNMERCYYGSRHGKNRCDGEAGVVKSKAKRLVQNEQCIITDAKSFYEAVKELELPLFNEDNSCVHRARSFIFVESEEIVRERPDRLARTVAGTRKIHSIQGLSRGKIAVRRLSCFCECCLKSNYDRCLNSHYVDNWKAVDMKPLTTDQNFVNRVPAVNLDSAEYGELPSDLDSVEPDPTLDTGTDPTCIKDISPNCSFSEIKPTSYPEGTYINVQHGSEVFPAVMVHDHLRPSRGSVDGWPWIKYFHTTRTELWVLQETRHTVLPEDVLCTLSPPDIQLIGSRVFYHFHGN